jgi:hypothetical protein
MQPDILPKFVDKDTNSDEGNKRNTKEVEIRRK